MNSEFERAGLRVFERGWLSSNNVLFPGGPNRPSVLIDSGYSTHAGQTVALVQAALDGRRLDRIVNTHLHSDHCGGNHALQQAFGCTVDVPAGEAAKVDAWDEDALTYRATGQDCPRFERGGSLAAGSEIQLGEFRWRVVAAPGHDPESIVLHQPELELLISADALWENGFGVVFPELEGESAFGDVRRTLEKIAELPVRWTIPGHGAPFQGVREALDRAFRRIDDLARNPVRHSNHAAKVLIKFHLLEVQAETVESLRRWISRASYFGTIHRMHFSARGFDDWTQSLVNDLCGSGALRRRDQWIHDH